MRPTGKRLALLGCVLAACAVLFLALVLTGREPPAETEAGYYFTNYPSAESVAVVSVENTGGSVVLARTNGTLRALSDYPVPGDEAAIAAFFQEVCRLPLRRMVEGAQASDGQYGLTEQEYISSLRLDLQKRILAYDPAQNVNVPAFLTDFLGKIENQKRVFKYVKIDQIGRAHV